jgi:hypothetical protein
LVKKFEGVEKARLAGSTSLFGLLGSQDEFLDPTGFRIPSWHRADLFGDFGVQLELGPIPFNLFTIPQLPLSYVLWPQDLGFDAFCHWFDFQHHAELD